MLAGLVTWDDQQLGLDPTVFYRQVQPPTGTGDIPHLIVVVAEAFKTADVWHTMLVEYAVEETLFRPYTLRGRGTTCWRVRKLQDGKPLAGASYLVLDSWVKGGKDMEHDILRQIQRTGATDDGTGIGIPAIAPLVHIDNVEISGPTPYTDAVQQNRGGARFGRDVDLVHTRTVLRCDGVLLEHFADVKELLFALHDVIQGTPSLPYTVSHSQYILKDMGKCTVIRVFYIGTLFPGTSSFSRVQFQAPEGSCSTSPALLLRPREHAFLALKRRPLAYIV